MAPSRGGKRENAAGLFIVTLRRPHADYARIFDRRGTVDCALQPGVIASRRNKADQVGIFSDTDDVMFFPPFPARSTWFRLPLQIK
jgi:hypothetical protein